MKSDFEAGVAFDLRQWLTRLGQSGRLAVIRENIALKHQLAAVAKRLDGRQAAYFPSPDGHTIPVVAQPTQ